MELPLAEPAWSCSSNTPGLILLLDLADLCARSSQGAVFTGTLLAAKGELGFTLQVLDVEHFVFPQRKHVCSQVCLALVPLGCAEFTHGCSLTRM